MFGLFLSSGVDGVPDNAMERLVGTARTLRMRHSFRGYIHLKVIPGASDAAVEEAIRVSSAVSLNIEVPGRRHFERLSKSKDFDRDIVRPLKLMSRLTAKGARHSGVKCTTQFIVGASDESDSEIVKYMDGIYGRLKFERIYFSAYQPGLGDASLPAEAKGLELDGRHGRLTREHRLYQTDFLMRSYGFGADEIAFGEDGFLSLDKDPKTIWAERHPDFFPVNLNKATKEELLRVPGLGPRTVLRLLKARRMHMVGSLSELGVKGVRLRLAECYSTAS